MGKQILHCADGYVSVTKTEAKAAFCAGENVRIGDYCKRYGGGFWNLDQFAKDIGLRDDETRTERGFMMLARFFNARYMRSGRPVYMVKREAGTYTIADGCRPGQNHTAQLEEPPTIVSFECDCRGASYSGKTKDDAMETMRVAIEGITMYRGLSEIFRHLGYHNYAVDDTGRRFPLSCIQGDFRYQTSM